MLGISCSEDFLENELIRGDDDENYFSNETQIFTGLVAAYDPMQWTFPGGSWASTVMLGDIRSDNARAGGDPTNNDQPGWQAIDDLVADPTLSESLQFWRKQYSGIRRANIVLLRGDLGTPVTDQYLAEAKFLRAFYHFELFRMFGPVPAIDFLVDPSLYSLKRDNMSTVFGLIEKDLKEAIPLLPVSYPDEFAGRATKGAAQGLLGKAYLYWADLDNDDAGKFDMAAAQFEAVIQSGQYELLDDYAEIYGFRNDFSVESVFEISHSNLETVGWEWGDGISGNMMIQLCGVRGLCDGHPDYIAGWGFMLPTQDLVDSYLDDDIYRRDATVIDQAELSADDCDVALSEQNTQDWQGYWQQKYANFNGYDTPLGGDINTVKDANQIYMRYADILLMHAEALVRGSGSEATAKEHINMVRERAKGPGNNTDYRTVDQLIAAESSLSSVLDVVFYERRAEFAGEGDRWFDLVRRGEFGAGSFDDASDLRRGNYTVEDNYLPIAQAEIDATGGALTAYPDASLFQ